VWRQRFSEPCLLVYLIRDKLFSKLKINFKKN